MEFLRPGMLACGHQCYNLEERCDGKRDCADGADEKVLLHSPEKIQMETFSTFSAAGTY